MLSIADTIHLFGGSHRYETLRFYTTNLKLSQRLSNVAFGIIVRVASNLVSGEKYVCADHQTDFVYELLERRLWDDPNKVHQHF